MTGIFCRISVRTLGTSPKKNRANTPAATPKPDAMLPYRTALPTDIPIRLGMCFVLERRSVSIYFSSCVALSVHMGEVWKGWSRWDHGRGGALSESYLGP